MFGSGLDSSRSHLWDNQLEAQEMRPEDWPELWEVCFRCVDFLSLSFDCHYHLFSFDRSIGNRLMNQASL